jgi:hypothetical protein
VGAADEPHQKLLDAKLLRRDKLLLVEKVLMAPKLGLMAETQLVVEDFRRWMRTARKLLGEAKLGGIHCTPSRRLSNNLFFAITKQNFKILTANQLANIETANNQQKPTLHMFGL